MSFAALAWAAKQKTGGLATKSVLLALANYADENGCAYPSTAAIAEFGEMDHKTATVALDRLIAAGLIADTGERAGRTKQVKVYRLALESQPETEAFQKRKPSVSSPKAPQKRGTDTIRDTPLKKASPSPKTRTDKPSAFDLPADIPADAWAGYEEMRKSIRKPMTPRARQLAVDRLHQLAEDGYPPGEVLNNSTLNNWQGLFPLKDDRNANARSSTGTSRNADGFTAALRQMQAG